MPSDLVTTSVEQNASNDNGFILIGGLFVHAIQYLSLRNINVLWWYKNSYMPIVW